jgi:hypothetical protein
MDPEQFVRERTNPVSEFEAQTLNRIFDIEAKPDRESWRLEKGVHCKKCKREFTMMDVALSGIGFHGMEFMRNAFRPQPAATPPKVAREDEEFAIVCLNCGVENVIKYPTYQYPVTSCRKLSYKHGLEYSGGLPKRS